MYRTPTIAACITALVLFAGCGGSQSQPRPADGSRAEAQHTSAEQAATTPARTQTTATTPSEESGSSSGGEPAFVEPSGPSPGGPVQEAEKAMRERGYTPVEPATYKPEQTLRVMIGKGSAGENAFFFIGNRYIGTDAKSASTHVSVAAQREGSVTLRYTLYSAGRPAGSTTVSFDLENGSLQPAEPIPPAARRNAG